jgi:2-oxoglutarate ferredoxin oxidoreductase subunit beta
MRGEKITTIFVNNAIFGMTGGQMAPTTLINQKTSTSGPCGRDKATYGSPLRISEMLATIERATFVERTSVHNVPGINRTKKAIRAAFMNQLNGEGFSIVEVLSTCPTGWGMTPENSMIWLERNMLEYFPLGNFRKPQEVA